jgi:hypothetical protein
MATMPKFETLALFVVLTCGIVAQTPADGTTVTGTLIDLACRTLDTDNTGNAHKGRGYNCAVACAREGFAVGVLTSDGKVYRLTGGVTADRNAKLVAHMSATVSVTGVVKLIAGQMTIAANDLHVVRE